jgi:hypothetical protein
MNRSLEAICIGIIIGLCIFIEYKVIMLQKKVDNLTQITDTITVTDTITNWQSDTVYFSHYDTIKLPVVDTINDTIIKIDSILVQIPISTTVYDTTITDSTYKTSLRAITSGFNVSMDSLYLSTEIIKQEPKITHKKWYNNFGVGVGLMYGTGGAGVGVGIMYKLF